MKRLRSLPLGTVAGVVVAIYIGVYLVATLSHNYQLEQQIADQQAQIKNLQTSNQTLKYQIQYYNTDSYKEKEARAKLGLQAPGEGVVILPHSGDDSTNVPTPADPNSKPAVKQSNWRQWINFLTGKSSP